MVLPLKKRLSSTSESSSTPQKGNLEIAKPNEDGPTPRTTRRRSVVAEEIKVTATPSTPTRRGRRLSGALTEDSNENGAGCATPTRRSRRLSGSLTDETTTAAVGTPTRRSRRLSGTGLESTTESSLVNADPLRRTRRSSGAGLDIPVDSPMPLGDTLRRTRRTSGTFSDISTDSPHAASLKRALPSDIDNKQVTPNKTPAKRGRRKSITLEEVAEENEETVSNTLDVIKEDEEEKNDSEEKKEKDINYVKENDNPIIDNEINKKEADSEKVNDSENVIDIGKEATTVEEKKSSKDETESEESSKKNDKLTKTLIEDNVASKISSILGTDVKLKPSEDIENKSLDSERMEVSESNPEDKSVTNVPSVVKYEDKSQKNAPLNNNTKVLNNKNENNNTLVKKVIPRGMPKSGRFWKTEKKKFSSINAVKPLKTSWAKKMELKNQRKSVLEESNAIKEEKRLKKEALKERQKLNKELRDKNAKKSEIVQVIKDPRKIKKMKRKQLRYIETRDTSQPAKII